MKTNDMNWVFPKNEGGQESGFHDPGVETFKGNFYRYLARELIQNSLDARRDGNKPAVVRFDVDEIPISDIPDARRLVDALQRCAEYWARNKKAREFFERTLKLLRKNAIPALKVGDYNTTGICGSDTDREKDWYNLIRCSGASSKGRGEGGSFGIGKNAPLAASRLRTVLYSTKNVDGEVAFQGVAKLVTHQHPAGGLAQATGYLGGSAGDSVRTESAIPKRFLRTKHGTDIIVLGFEAEAAWREELIFSVLENFWPAIHLKDLEVYVDDRRISAENLGDLLETYAGKEGFSAHQYYRAFTSPSSEVHRKLPILDKVDLYLLVGEQDLSKRVAMVRKTGMVIYHRLFRSPLPFCGVFVCRNDKGNEVLRDMEPPRHDEWDPDHPEKGSNKKTEAELGSFIRECIRALTPADDSKSLSIPGLSRFLPDDEESAEERFDREADADKPEESADRKPKVQKLDGRKIDPRRRHLQPDDTQPGMGQEPTAEPEGEGVKTEPNGQPNDAGSGSGRPGDGEEDSKASAGGPGGGGGKPPIPIFYRTFARNLPAGVYSAVISPKKKGSSNAVLRINEVGDDGGKIPAEIKQARSSGGELLGVTGNAVGPLRLEDGRPLVLEIVLATPARVSMEVEAHEA